MAEEKKPDTGPFHENFYQNTLYLLAGLVLLSIMVGQVTLQVRATDWFGVKTLWGSIVLWLESLWFAWHIIGMVLAGVFIVWSGYNLLKLLEIKKEEKKIYGVKPEAESGTPPVVERENERWVRVIAHINSVNPAEWRQAIIESDIMLEELLRASGYHGDGVGEMLKSVEPSDMLTLDAAWEAHKVRNRIAHAGSDFELSEREAKRIITLFESIFKEYQII